MFYVKTREKNVETCHGASLQFLRFLREKTNYKFTMTFPSNSPVLTK